MKVVYVIPTHFDDSSVIAGAERYAYGLAKAMARRADTSLITFSDKNATRKDGELTIKYHKALCYIRGITNPFSVRFLKDLKDADVIHCLQFRTVVTELAVLYGAFMKKKVFMTDLAGGARYNLSSFLPVWKGIQALLLISEYNRKLQSDFPVGKRIIYGGVDPDLFSPGDTPKNKGLLYVGRIFHPKGIHILLEALPQEANLEVIGKSHDDIYLSRLKKMSLGKKVTFSHDIADSELVRRYQKSSATILPSLADGGFTTAMESMACGTPVIGTKVGSLPEIVNDGITGFLVPPNNPAAIREKIKYLYENPGVAEAMGRRGREVVLKRFTWDTVARRCLEAYEVVGN